MPYKGESLQSQGKRFARELHNRQKDTGESLTGSQAGYRMGVLAERKRQADIWKWRNGKKNK